MDNQNPTDPNQGGIGGGMPTDPNQGGQPGQDAPAIPAEPVLPQTPEVPVAETPQPDAGQSIPEVGGDQSGQNPTGGTPVV